MLTFLPYPVSTRRRFNVVTMLLMSKQRCYDVKTMLCAPCELTNRSMYFNELFTGFVMDMYTFQYYYKLRLSKLNVKYVVQREYPMDDYYYGMSFFDMDKKNIGNGPESELALPSEYRQCMEDYIQYNYHFRDKMERHYREAVFDLVCIL